MIFFLGEPADVSDSLNPDWVPHLNLGYESSNSTVSADRYDRLQKRHFPVKSTSAQSTPAQSTTTTTTTTQSANNSFDSAEVADIEMGRGEQEVPTAQKPDNPNPSQTPRPKPLNPCSYCSYLKSENQNLKTKIEQLEAKCETLENQTSHLTKIISDKSFTQESFENDNERGKYYTGLPSFTILLTIFNLVKAFLPHGPNSKTSKWQEFIMVLMRMRLGLPVKVISDIFGISESSGSRIILKVLDVLYVRLKPSIFWPDRETLHKTMPREFRLCFKLKTTVIIDCFELFIERPSNLLARAMTYSNYKHHNTVGSSVINI